MSTLSPELLAAFTLIASQETEKLMSLEQLRNKSWEEVDERNQCIAYARMIVARHNARNA